MNNLNKQIKKICDKIMQILNKSSTIFINEEISQLDHALQCAKFAKDAKYEDEVTIACLLHDIGNLIEEKDINLNIQKMNNLGNYKHEILGSIYLRQLGFSDKIVELVKNHVNAKRYLVSKNRNYLKKLSNASNKTLENQGYLMNNEEMNNFEKNKYFRDIIRLREYDDKAKKMNIKIYPLVDYYDMIYNHLLRNTNIKIY